MLTIEPIFVEDQLDETMVDHNLTVIEEYGIITWMELAFIESNKIAIKYLNLILNVLIDLERFEECITVKSLIKLIS